MIMNMCRSVVVEGYVCVYSIYVCIKLFTDLHEIHKQPVYVCVCVYVYTYIYVYVCACVYDCQNVAELCICMYVYIYICIYICIYI
jgi:hypothetical protein